MTDAVAVGPVLWGQQIPRHRYMLAVPVIVTVWERPA